MSTRLLALAPREPASSQSVAAARALVAAYYTRKVRRHGATPAGVDWPSATGQSLRFALLLRLCDFTAPFSLNDIGCGYGALLGYLREHHAAAVVDYVGSDLSLTMLQRAGQLWQGCSNTRFVHTGASPRVADYAVASGIFNVVPAGATRCWEDLVAATLGELHANVRRGFAVNFLAPALPQATLYRTMPRRWIDYCEQGLGASVEPLAGYGLNEFTLLVRRNG